ncbi:FxSxx-COOH system tetratricopeptide repeat protein [Streptomyces sp. NBC_01476]|uniref:FxSxx-COOH system tetratricopeptide repeat protein n=1 Tax=Streptomyces sp. NBC_01476 TaxID=2903881 RepID=UPI002E3347D4|nr:FxSxx-COOH system tetratricopeptide repeat protein [Streptomyces sp. NBC_01476]
MSSPAQGAGELQNHAAAACVALLTADGAADLLGSGFFVAPGKVLTCAHVVAGHRRVTVRSSAGDDRGDVVLAVPREAAEEGPWPLPDLALIDVPATPAVQIDAYLRRVTGHDSQPFRYRPTGYPKPLDQTYMAALDDVVTASPAAGELLKLLSLMASAPTPVRMFGNLPALAGTLPSPGLASLPQLLERGGSERDIVNVIRRHSLARITLDQDEQTIEMHRVPQRVIEGCIPEADLGVYRHLIHLMLRERDLVAARSVSQWQIMLDIWRNLESSQAWDCTRCAGDQTTRSLMLHVIRTLMVWGESEHSVITARAVLATWEPILGSDHTDIREATLELANALRNQGAAKESLELDQALADRIEEVPDTRPEIAIRVGLNLGGDLRRLGRYAEAREVDERTRERAAAEFGENDRLSLMARNNAAVSSLLLAEPRRALEQDQALWRDQRRIRGDGDRATLIALNRIARAHRDLGEYRQAAEMQEQTAQRCRKLFEPDSVIALTATLNLAACLRAVGSYDEGWRNVQNVVEPMRRVLGAEHPEHIMALSELASALRCTGRATEALVPGRRAVDLSVAVNGEDHPSTAICRNNLALVHLALRDGYSAEPLFEAAAAAFGTSLPQDHPHALAVRVNRATGAWLRREYERADRAETETQPLLNRTLGEDHPWSLAGAANHVTTIDALGSPIRRIAANGQWERTKYGYARTLGREHPDAMVCAGRSSRVLIGLDAPSV